MLNGSSAFPRKEIGFLVLSSWIFFFFFSIFSPEVREALSTQAWFLSLTRGHKHIPTHNTAAPTQPGQMPQHSSLRREMQSERQENPRSY